MMTEEELGKAMLQRARREQKQPRMPRDPSAVFAATLHEAANRRADIAKWLKDNPKGATRLEISKAFSASVVQIGTDMTYLLAGGHVRAKKSGRNYRYWAAE